MPPLLPSSRSPLVTLTSSHTSFESTVPCVNRCPTLSVRMTVSSRYVLAGFQGRHFRTQRRVQAPFDRPSVPDAEDVHPHALLQELLVGLDRLVEL